MSFQDTVVIKLHSNVYKLGSQILLSCSYTVTRLLKGHWCQQDFEPFTEGIHCISFIINVLSRLLYPQEGERVDDNGYLYFLRFLCL